MENKIIFNSYLKKNLYLFYKGRVALYTLLESMGVGSGDEVILPAYTCVVVPNAILYRGARPIYVDVDLSTFTAQPCAIATMITPLTKVVLCQNTYGLSAFVDETVLLCREQGIWTIEDCTHGYGGTFKGKPNGSYCDAAFYSSQWNKPFSTGIGGYALVNDIALEKKVETALSDYRLPSLKNQAMLWLLMRVRGLISASTYYSFIAAYRYLSKKNLVTGSSSSEELESIKMPEGYLCSMSAVQKHSMKKALEGLPTLNALRKANGILYTAHLMKNDLNHVAQTLHEDHMFLKYPLMVRDREEFIRKAMEARIPLGDWFRSPLHPVEGDLNKWCFEPERYPNAVFAAKHVVNLPTDTHHPDHVLEFVDRNRDLVMETSLGGRIQSC